MHSIQHYFSTITPKTCISFPVKRGIKSHFETTYVNVGGSLLLACLLGLQFDASIPWFGALVLGICYGLFLYAKQLKNLSLYVLVVFAGYVALSNLYYSPPGFVSHESILLVVEGRKFNGAK